MSDDELVAEHDRVAKNTMVGLNYYLEELTRREFVRSSAAALREARAARRLALANAGVAIVAVLVAISIPIVLAYTSSPPPEVMPCVVVDGDAQRPALCVAP